LYIEINGGFEKGILKGTKPEQNKMSITEPGQAKAR